MTHKNWAKKAETLTCITVIKWEMIYDKDYGRPGQQWNLTLWYEAVQGKRYSRRLSVSKGKDTH